MVLKDKCEEKVFHDWHNYPCKNKAIIEVNGKSYCGIHNPIRIAEKRKQRDIKFEKEMEELRYKKLANEYCKSKGLTIKDLQNHLEEGKEDLK